MNVIPYGKQDIRQEDIDAVISTLTSDYLTQGPKILEFEKAFAAYTGARYAVAVANGTAALHLSAMALNVQPGDKVITTPITFAASANCVRYCGGEVVFCDIDPHTYLIDIKQLRKLLGNHPANTFKGIIPVDFAGYPVDLEALRALADEYGLWIIEDACHSPGGYFTDSKGVKQHCGNGNFADLSVFSFHPVKHIAAGEGGMITTNNEALYQKLLLLRTHGITREQHIFENSPALATAGQDEKNYPGWYMEMQELGFNYRLTDFQAALGLSQLNRADAGLERRKQIARKYDEAFLNHGDIKSLGLELASGNVSHAYHLYVIQAKDRLGLYNYLRQHNIFPQIHYIPVHLMPYYQKQGWKKGDLPEAEYYYEGCLSLPMYPSLSKEEQDFVIEQILSYFGNKN
jgi:UDP-4-amino-4,6-dideoxy-N-acetyl-beta-L-altrosamine transaminase